MKTWMWLLLGGGVAFLLIRSAHQSKPVTTPLTESERAAIIAAHKPYAGDNPVSVNQLAGGMISVSYGSYTKLFANAISAVEG